MKTAVEIVLCLTMIGATLVFGGAQPLTQSLLVLVLLAAALMVLLRQTLAGEIQVSIPLPPALFVGWVLLEMLPWPVRLVSALAPQFAPNPHNLPFPPPGSGWLQFSIYPHETLLALLSFVAYLAAFALAAYVFESAKRRSVLIATLIILGCFEAVYGSIQYLTGWQKIFTYTKQFDLLEATGTYINRNHFAGLLELTAPFALAAAFHAYLTWAQERRAPYPGAARGSAAFRMVFYCFLLLVMGLGVFLSHSRAGILGFFVSNVFIALLAQLGTARKTWGVAMVVLAACLLAYGAWIGLGPVSRGFEQLNEPGYVRTEARMTIWRDTLHLLHQRPIVGTGLGTFRVAYRRYQTALIDYDVDHAHNDYLEFAAGTGLVGAALLFLPIVYLFCRMIVSFLNDPRRFGRSVTLGCVGSTLAILLHSATDFNLQIPANACIFAVVLGVGYKAACLEPRQMNLLELTQNRSPKPSGVT